MVSPLVFATAVAGFVAALYLAQHFLSRYLAGSQSEERDREWITQHVTSQDDASS